MSAEILSAELREKFEYVFKVNFFFYIVHITLQTTANVQAAISVVVSTKKQNTSPSIRSYYQLQITI